MTGNKHIFFLGLTVFLFLYIVNYYILRLFLPFQFFIHIVNKSMHKNKDTYTTNWYELSKKAPRGLGSINTLIISPSCNTLRFQCEGHRFAFMGDFVITACRFWLASRKLWGFCCDFVVVIVPKAFRSGTISIYYNVLNCQGK